MEGVEEGVDTAGDTVFSDDSDSDIENSPAAEKGEPTSSSSNGSSSSSDNESDGTESRDAGSPAGEARNSLASKSIGSDSPAPGPRDADSSPAEARAPESPSSETMDADSPAPGPRDADSSPAEARSPESPSSETMDADSPAPHSPKSVPRGADCPVAIDKAGHSAVVKDTDSPSASRNADSPSSFSRDATSPPATSENIDSSGSNSRKADSSPPVAMNIVSDVEVGDGMTEVIRSDGKQVYHTVNVNINGVVKNLMVPLQDSDQPPPSQVFHAPPQPATSGATESAKPGVKLVFTTVASPTSSTLAPITISPSTTTGIREITRSKPVSILPSTAKTILPVIRAAGGSTTRPTIFFVPNKQPGNMAGNKQTVRIPFVPGQSSQSSIPVIYPVTGGITSVPRSQPTMVLSSAGKLTTAGRPIITVMPPGASAKPTSNAPFVFMQPNTSSTTAPLVVTSQPRSPRTSTTVKVVNPHISLTAGYTLVPVTSSSVLKPSDIFNVPTSKDQDLSALLKNIAQQTVGSGRTVSSAATKSPMTSILVNNPISSTASTRFPVKIIPSANSTRFPVKILPSAAGQPVKYFLANSPGNIPRSASPNIRFITVPNTRNPVVSGVPGAVSSLRPMMSVISPAKTANTQDIKIDSVYSLKDIIPDTPASSVPAVSLIKVKEEKESSTEICSTDSTGNDDKDSENTTETNDSTIKKEFIVGKTDTSRKERETTRNVNHHPSKENDNAADVQLNLGDEKAVKESNKGQDEEESEYESGCDDEVATEERKQQKCDQRKESTNRSETKAITRDERAKISTTSAINKPTDSAPHVTMGENQDTGATEKEDFVVLAEWAMDDDNASQDSEDESEKESEKEVDVSVDVVSVNNDNSTLPSNGKDVVDSEENKENTVNGENVENGKDEQTEKSPVKSTKPDEKDTGTEIAKVESEILTPKIGKTKDKSGLGNCDDGTENVIIKKRKLSASVSPGHSASSSPRAKVSRRSRKGRYKMTMKVMYWKREHKYMFDCDVSLPELNLGDSIVDLTTFKVPEISKDILKTLRFLGDENWKDVLDRMPNRHQNRRRGGEKDANKEPKIKSEEKKLKKVILNKKQYRALQPAPKSDDVFMIETVNGESRIVKVSSAAGLSVKSAPTTNTPVSKTPTIVTVNSAGAIRETKLTSGVTVSSTTGTKTVVTSGTGPPKLWPVIAAPTPNAPTKTQPIVVGRLATTALTSSTDTTVTTAQGTAPRQILIPSRGHGVPISVVQSPVLPNTKSVSDTVPVTVGGSSVNIPLAMLVRAQAMGCKLAIQVPSTSANVRSSAPAIQMLRPVMSTAASTSSSTVPIVIQPSTTLAAPSATSLLGVRTTAPQPSIIAAKPATTTTVPSVSSARSADGQQKYLVLNTSSGKMIIPWSACLAKPDANNPKKTMFNLSSVVPNLAGNITSTSSTRPTMVVSRGGPPVSSQGLVKTVTLNTSAGNLPVVLKRSVTLPSATTGTSVLSMNTSQPSKMPTIVKMTSQGFKAIQPATTTTSTIVVCRPSVVTLGHSTKVSGVPGTTMVSQSTTTCQTNVTTVFHQPVSSSTGVTVIQPKRSPAARQNRMIQRLSEFMSPAAAAALAATVAPEPLNIEPIKIEPDDTPNFNFPIHIKEEPQTEGYGDETQSTSGTPRADILVKEEPVSSASDSDSDDSSSPPPSKQARLDNDKADCSPSTSFSEARASAARGRIEELREKLRKAMADVDEIRQQRAKISSESDDQFP